MANISTNKTNTLTNLSEIRLNKTNISTNTTIITMNKRNITTNEKNVATNTGEITNLQSTQSSYRIKIQSRTSDILSNTKNCNKYDKYCKT